MKIKKLMSISYEFKEANACADFLGINLDRYECISSVSETLRGLDGFFFRTRSSCRCFDTDVAYYYVNI